MAKPSTNPAFPSIIITTEAADLIAAYGTACSELGAASQEEVHERYARYLVAKQRLCSYMERIEDQAESVVNQSHNYTRIRF